VSCTKSAGEPVFTRPLQERGTPSPSSASTSGVIRAMTVLRSAEAGLAAGMRVQAGGGRARVRVADPAVRDDTGGEPTLPRCRAATRGLLPAARRGTDAGGLERGKGGTWSSVAGWSEGRCRASTRCCSSCSWGSSCSSLLQGRRRRSRARPRKQELGTGGARQPQARRTGRGEPRPPLGVAGTADGVTARPRATLLCHGTAGAI
jgi:hypothetical protein